jgi:hypothetical protein
MLRIIIFQIEQDQLAGGNCQLHQDVHHLLWEGKPVQDAHKNPTWFVAVIK